MIPMVTHASIPAGEHVPSADQRVVSYGVPWSRYEAQLALRGEAPVPRIAYQVRAFRDALHG